jgi:D-alanyl-D-alanine carboxypeptidase (penicillin-binding protein 5/6)
VFYEISLSNLKSSARVEILPDDYALKSEVLELDCAGIKAGAIGTLESGIVASCGDTSALPTASMAKTITALVTLEHSNDVDKVIVLDDDDYSIWQSVFQLNGSNIRIFVDEEVTLKKLLTGMMVASANNLAESIVRHEFGSFESYKQAATQYLQQHNLLDTRIGTDASGFDESTVASAANMIEIGRLALQNVVLSEIVRSQTVEFPRVGGGIEIETTTNPLLKDGYIGIKTGYTDEAGDCILFAKRVHDQFVGIGVVMGANYQAIKYSDAEHYTSSLAQAIAEQTIVERGATVGILHYSNGKVFDYRTSDELTVTVLPNVQADASIDISDDNATVTVELLNKSVVATLPNCPASPAWYDIFANLFSPFDNPYCF